MRCGQLLSSAPIDASLSATHLRMIELLLAMRCAHVQGRMGVKEESKAEMTPRRGDNQKEGPAHVAQPCEGSELHVGALKCTARSRGFIWAEGGAGHQHVNPPPPPFG